MAPNRKKPSRDDGKELWRRVSRSVTPLQKGRQAFGSESKDEGLFTESMEKADANRLCGVAAASIPAPKAKKTPPLLSHGSVAGLDKRSGERLRRGKLPIEARIDLHGMNQTEAHRALINFIDRQQAAGKRCVSIITGKGTYRGGAGILREAVPRWLNEPSIRRHILAFSHAQPKDGGTGALYVLLRRTRYS
ncbi:MAG: DNA mismatch repair protein MutS [Rhodospirillaceae bacterium]|nr:DNA mismatch repair protein MutS [Rhodospirillaceae bacterium]